MTGGHDRQAKFMLEWLEYEVQYRSQPEDKARLLLMLTELVDILDRGAIIDEGLDWDAYRAKVREIRRVIYRLDDPGDGE